MAYDITTPAAQMLMGDLNDMPSLEDVFFVKGKVAIVTGGSSGLGFNVTARLLQGGANVVMASFNPAEENNACGVLEAKGFVEHRRMGGSGRTFVYSPMLTREKYVTQVLRDVKDTIFGSSVKKMLSFFVQNEDINEQELAEILSIINNPNIEIQ